MSADEDRALLGGDAEPVEQGLALGIGLDVMPAERDQVALEQLSDCEGLAGRASADQQLVAVALAFQPLTTRDHRAQEQVAQLRGAGDHRAQFIRGQDENRALLGDDAAGERRLACEHGDVGGEGPRLALGEVMVAIGLAVDDVDCPREDDVERRIALGLLEDDFARRQRQGLAARRQLLDLGRGEARKEHRIVWVQEGLDRGRWGVRAHDLDRNEPSVPGRAATIRPAE